MAFPAGVGTCVVTGRYLDAQQVPVCGWVDFVLPLVLVDATGHVIIVPGLYTAELVDGYFSIELPFTDNPDVDPSGWSYQVLERLPGGRTYYIELPRSSGATVDISTLVPSSGSSTPVWANAPFGLLAGANAWTGGNTFTGAVTVPTPTSSGQAATKAYVDGSHQSSPAWQFDVTAYGAVGDGEIELDAATATGSAVVACTTSTPFHAGDVGKAIVVKGAGTFGVTTLVTTIAGYTDAGHVTMAVTAPTSISSAMVLWATDDTDAVQDALDAAGAYAIARAGYGQVWVPAAPSGRFYGIAGPLQTGAPTYGNAQLAWPVNADTNNKITVEMAGPGNPTATRHWNQTKPITMGACLVSFGAFASIGAQIASLNAGGMASMLGGPTGANGYGTSAGLVNNVMATLTNLSLLTTHSVNGLGYGAFNWHGMACASLENISYGTIGTHAAGDFNTPVTFANGLVVGGIMPASGNNDLCQIRNLWCQGGYTRNLFLTEHGDWQGGMSLYGWSGIGVVGSYGDGGSASGSFHAANWSQVSVEGCSWDVEIIGSGASGVGPQIHGILDDEGVPRFHDDTAGIGLADAVGLIRVVGGNNLIATANPTGLQILNDLQNIGPAATPAFTLGVPQINTYWRPARVLLSGGTVTAVKVSALMGGQSAPAMTTVWTGALTTPISIDIPPGGWWEIDGSVEPTVHHWSLS